ncbi:Hypothetical predicted protein [Olea europaea subsp. europaea]|uniref:Uncharacterized protein n=1 Tax=Olea europaea subsp. europaea TaxID=158383 RepID=A0A8S0S2Y1_OLEEU|nr:Hypothetical predicted protein [Olea europaea subsp. europaea]
MKLKKFVIGVESQISDDYPLTSPLEVPKLNGNSLENSVEGQVALAALPKLEVVNAEGEDDDELTSSEVLASIVGDGIVHSAKGNGCLSFGHDGILLQDASSTGDL